MSAPVDIAVDAMILAAGRGERMRPLTDTLPKPLVPVRGAPLIEHHIQKLVAIGVRRIVINVSYHADALMRALGDGARFGCELLYSVEQDALESGGGVATASKHFRHGAIILISADIFSSFDYARLLLVASEIREGRRDAHFVMVPPTEGEPGGEFALDDRGRIHAGEPRLTLANIAVLASARCQSWPRGERFKLLPHYQSWVAAGRVSGECFHGVWCNVTRVEDVTRLNAL
ncbi:MAG: nucleotidyltransferase family protein [Burkholderiales bacterium]|nr:nucleotidyltransferase family protein [Burkholderiales bacterium]